MPYEFIAEETERTVSIPGTDFEMTGMFPPFWSDVACAMTASKYFAKGETSVCAMISRVVGAIMDGGIEGGYFLTLEVAKLFAEELGQLVYNQEAAFNTPVWLNLGVANKPQCSACFILDIQDTMTSIMEYVKQEAHIFKRGSGSGCNFSTLRPDGAPLSKGGTASGPVSFMKGFDAFAGIIKSGGRMRRAAKMAILNDDHEDIDAFIWSKSLEEDKAKDLIALGYPSDYEGPVYKSLNFQNTNHSVRIMEEPDEDIVSAIARAAHNCGDPGVQFHETINRFNPVKDEEIVASNPCSEYMFLNNTACNLASINVMKFLTIANGIYTLDSVKLENVVSALIIAMDIICEISAYPTKEITDKTQRYRPLGLGYTNLGATLMSANLPYNSVKGRELAKTIAYTIHKQAATTSVALATLLGPYEGYAGNEESQKEVLLAQGISEDLASQPMRNAQLTVMAPTGTISLMMDCESTGIEPVYALKSLKTLSGGGEIEAISSLEEDADDSPVYETAETNKFGRRVSADAHLRMMEAVQPHISGAISKTVNLPEETTVEEIEELIYSAYEKQLKAIAFYRDGCKGSQPLNNKVKRVAGRQSLPATRKAITHKFEIGGHEGYCTVGMYDDGSPGELFINMSKEGSTIKGLLDTVGILTSKLLQQGVSVEELSKKFRGVKFEPSGWTPERGHADSVIDYIFRWLGDLFNKVECDDQEVEHGAPCPNCGGIMIRGANCFECKNCGETGGCS